MSNTTRTTDEVFQSHLQLRKEGKLEEDIKNNYAENVVIITRFSTFHGHDGVRASAQKLQSYTKGAEFSYKRQVVEGTIAYLVWDAASKDIEVEDGTDTLLIEDGKILIQTIYYTVKNK